MGAARKPSARNTTEKFNDVYLWALLRIIEAQLKISKVNYRIMAECESVQRQPCARDCFSWRGRSSVSTTSGSESCSYTSRVQQKDKQSGRGEECADCVESDVRALSI